jgi:peptidyl-prolyl cis-trans isomerase C
MKSLTRILVLLVLLGAPSCKKQKDHVLAVVNGHQVTQSEFDAYLKLKRIPTNDQKRVIEVLDKYLEREALAAVIEREKLLDKELAQAELNEFRKEMTISRYFEKYLEDKVNDTAIKNFYEVHAKDYDEKKVHVAHILIRTAKGMNETERKAKLTTAQQVHAELLAGKDFAQLAEKYSEDKVSSRQGGDLGWMKEGSVDPRFSKTVFEMQPGTVSEPFETAFGFHVVKVIEGARTVQAPFAAKSGDIGHELRNKAKEAEVNRLKSQVKIEKKEPYQPGASGAEKPAPDKAHAPAAAASVASSGARAP